MAGTIDELSKTNHGEITLDLRRDKDRKTDQGGKGGGGGRFGMGTSPAGALAHLPCCHTKEDTSRVGLKDGGEREEVFFFPPDSVCSPKKMWRM